VTPKAPLPQRARRIPSPGRKATQLPINTDPAGDQYRAAAPLLPAGDQQQPAQRRPVIRRSLANNHASMSLCRYRIRRGVGFKYTGPAPRYRNCANCPTVSRAYRAASGGVSSGSERSGDTETSRVLMPLFRASTTHPRKRTVIP
jgi:hypothetical protein